MTAYLSIVVNPLRQMLGDSTESCDISAHGDSGWLGYWTGWLSCALGGVEMRGLR